MSVKDIWPYKIYRAQDDSPLNIILQAPILIEEVYFVIHLSGLCKTPDFHRLSGTKYFRGFLQFLHANAEPVAPHVLQFIIQ
jgi:hypothetical protein